MADFAGNVAERYSTAILQLAQEEGALPGLERDLRELERAIIASEDLRRFVQSPIFDRVEHARGMKAVLAEIGATTLTTRFVLLLASKRRLFMLVDIVRTFLRQLSKLRGEVDARVTSARALTESEVNELRTAIKARVGREARLDARVDPTLLGGLVVQVGSRMIDSSLRTKLNGIHRAMRGT